MMEETPALIAASNGRHVDLVQRLVVDVRAAAVGVVAHKVLDLGHDVLRLDALDLGHAHLAGQERVFAEGVVAAAEFEVAVDVHKGLQGRRRCPARGLRGRSPARFPRPSCG
jgi:hypothetical protein